MAGHPMQRRVASGLCGSLFGMLQLESGHCPMQSACLKGAKKRQAQQRFVPNFPHGLTRWKFLDRNSGAELLIVHRPGDPTPIGKPSL
jgi:hypothetical protein